MYYYFFVGGQLLITVYWPAAPATEIAVQQKLYIILVYLSWDLISFALAITSISST